MWVGVLRSVVCDCEQNMDREMEMEGRVEVGEKKQKSFNYVTSPQLLERLQKTPTLNVGLI